MEIFMCAFNGVKYIMLTKTNFSVDIESIQIAENNLPSDEFRLAINEPTGDFFYDPWTIKEEYKNTIWYHILKSLTIPHGEARIILLDEGRCYQSHADIDDRYHLNISGTDSYIIDLEKNQLHDLVKDGHWYLMQARNKHTAANFGRGVRAQLVVRMLLKDGDDGTFVPVSVRSTLDDKEESRYRFDAVLSPVLNALDKLRMMSKFTVTNNGFSLKLKPDAIDSLRNKLPEGFAIDD
jgi:hypothetical protein